MPYLDSTGCRHIGASNKDGASAVRFELLKS